MKQKTVESETLLAFLHDVVLEFKGRMGEAEREAGDFEAGRAMAFYEVLEHLKNQGEVFELPLEEIALGGTLPTTSTRS